MYQKLSNVHGQLDNKWSLLLCLSATMLYSENICGKGQSHNKSIPQFPLCCIPFVTCLLSRPARGEQTHLGGEFRQKLLFCTIIQKGRHLTAPASAFVLQSSLCNHNGTTG